MSELPQAPEGAVVDGSTILLEVVEQGQVHPLGRGDRHGTALLAIEAQPVTDEVRGSAVATATVGSSSGPQRLGG